MAADVARVKRGHWRARDGSEAWIEPNGKLGWDVYVALGFSGNETLLCTKYEQWEAEVEAECWIKS